MHLYNKSEILSTPFAKIATTVDIKPRTWLLLDRGRRLSFEQELDIGGEVDKEASLIKGGAYHSTIFLFIKLPLVD